MSFANPLPPGIRQVVPDYVSDGVTLAWGFPFRLWATVDLAVLVSSNAGASWTALNNGTDFTVAIVGTTAATVTLAVAQASGNLIRVQGLRTPSRLTSVVNDGVIQSTPMESELDVVEATLQEVRRDISNVAQTLAESLPTSLPAAAGILWNNGGVLCVS